MGEFLHKYNTDNVHSRAVIVGVVNLLNSRVMYEQVLSDTDIEMVYVPFYYNNGGDERFMQDYFLQWNDCIHPKHADGNYDVIPRGIVTMSSKTIDTSKLTHRFVRGTFVKEIGGKLQQFNAYINSLPISMNFDVEIEVDTNLDAFKVEQSIMETFYKTQVFSVNFRGFRIPCQVGFADDYGVEKTFEFTYQANARILVKFSLSLETYYPVTDPTTERSNANRMDLGRNGSAPFEIWPENYTAPRLAFEMPMASEKYYSGSMLPISWTYTGPILRVNIFYRIKGNPDWAPIALNSNNRGFYNWEVPFFDNDGKEISGPPQKMQVLTKNGKGANLYPVINALGELEKVIVLSEGLGYLGSDTAELFFQNIPFNAEPTIVPPTIQTNIVDGKVIGVDILDSGSGYVPSPMFDIELKIVDANSESVYQELTSKIKFTGSMDNTLSDPENLQITNVVPVVSELTSTGLVVGLNLTGYGIQPGTFITEMNPITNIIKINKPSTTQITNEDIESAATLATVIVQ